jgi:hypothetical protein
MDVVIKPKELAEKKQARLSTKKVIDKVWNAGERTLTRSTLLFCAILVAVQNSDREEGTSSHLGI